jgi:hypothetical protein
MGDAFSYPASPLSLASDCNDTIPLALVILLFFLPYSFLCLRAHLSSGLSSNTFQRYNLPSRFDQ